MMDEIQLPVISYDAEPSGTADRWVFIDAQNDEGIARCGNKNYAEQIVRALNDRPKLLKLLRAVVATQHKWNGRAYVCRECGYENGEGRMPLHDDECLGGRIEAAIDDAGEK